MMYLVDFLLLVSWLFIFVVLWFDYYNNVFKGKITHLTQLVEKMTIWGKTHLDRKIKHPTEESLLSIPV